MITIITLSTVIIILVGVCFRQFRTINNFKDVLCAKYIPKISHGCGSKRGQVRCNYFPEYCPQPELAFSPPKLEITFPLSEAVKRIKFEKQLQKYQLESPLALCETSPPPQGDWT